MNQLNHFTFYILKYSWWVSWIKYIKKNLLLRYILYGTKTNNRRKPGGQLVSSQPASSWHGSYNLNILQTNPLQIFIIKSLVCQHLYENKCTQVVYTLDFSNHITNTLVTCVLVLTNCLTKARLGKFVLQFKRTQFTQHARQGHRNQETLTNLLPRSLFHLT